MKVWKKYVKGIVFSISEEFRGGGDFSHLSFLENVALDAEKRLEHYSQFSVGARSLVKECAAKLLIARRELETLQSLLQGHSYETIESNGNYYYTLSELVASRVSKCTGEKVYPKQIDTWLHNSK